MIRGAFALALSLVWGVAPVPVGAETIQFNLPAEGSVSREDGLAAWGRIYEVTSHPRCANCHVGPSDVPMWSGPSYGKTRPHGMNIRAGESRIGAEYVPCQSCHAYNETEGQTGAHMAPRVAASWQLAPVEADWFGKSAVEICNQLRDPERNGGRTMRDLAEHLHHDVVLHWAWAPGGGRQPAPYSLQDHVDDILAWGTAGFPCEND